MGARPAPSGRGPPPSRAIRHAAVDARAPGTCAANRSSSSSAAAGPCPWSRAAESALRSWPITAAAAAPCPTTSPTAIATRSSSELDHVVPVAAGLDAFGAGQVPGVQGETWELRQPLGQQAALQRLGDLVLGPVEPGPVQSLGALLGRASRVARSVASNCRTERKPTAIAPILRPPAASGTANPDRNPRPVNASTISGSGRSELLEVVDPQRVPLPERHGDREFRLQRDGRGSARAPRRRPRCGPAAIRPAASNS